MRRTVIAMLFAGLALGSCGGGDEPEDPQDVLDRAFSTSIDSADLTLDVSIQLQGSPGLGQPVRISASGPFRTNEKRLPSMDVELKVGTDGGGQTITTGFLSTGDRAFVKFQDVYYEQPPGQVARANRSIARNQGRRGSLRALGLDPSTWLAEAEDEGEEEIAGVTTRRISGRLDVEAVMRNLNEFVRKSAGALGGATGQTPPDPLSEDDIRTIGEVVRDPVFNVYVGKDDDMIRRLAGNLELEVPEASREELGGIESGAIEFELELANVNGDQHIEPPANARPLSALAESLGATPGLGGVVGDEAGGSAPAEPEGEGGGTAAPPDADDFQAYAECLDKARPEDTEALQTCAELLGQP